MRGVFCSAGPPVSEPRLIRKYANRRLYDATASRHVTLEDIRKLDRQRRARAGGRRPVRRGPDALRAAADHRRAGTVRRAGAERAAARGHHPLLRQPGAGHALALPRAEPRQRPAPAAGRAGRDGQGPGNAAGAARRADAAEHGDVGPHAGLDAVGAESRACGERRRPQCARGTPPPSDPRNEGRSWI